MAVRQVINTPLPLPPPDALVLSPLRATECTPDLGVAEHAVHMPSAEGMQADPRHTPTQQTTSRTLVQQWLRVLRRADASWRAG